MLFDRHQQQKQQQKRRRKNRCQNPWGGLLTTLTEFHWNETDNDLQMSKKMTQTPSEFSTQNNSTQSTYLPLLCATKFEPILVLLIQKMVSNLNLHLKLLFGSFCKITPVSQYEGVWLRIPLMHWACCWPNNIGYLIVYPIGCSTECFPLSVWLTVHSESPAIQDIPPPLCHLHVFSVCSLPAWPNVEAGCDGKCWRSTCFVSPQDNSQTKFLKTAMFEYISIVWPDVLCPVSQIRILQRYLGLGENLTNLF